MLSIKMFSKHSAANEPPLVLVLFWYMVIFRSAIASTNATTNVELEHLSPITPVDIHELIQLLSKNLS